MYILGIESSCDETAAAVVQDGRTVLSNRIDSQIDIHKRYGGVVPEIASRNHVMKLPFMIEQAIDEAGITMADINAIGVTYGPGLVGAVLIGLSTAKSLAYALDVPLIGVNHISGHIAANYLEHHELEPPFLSLIVSGGHSHLVMVHDYTSYEIIGKTRDDAAGEAFDKVARVLGLGYPGGPKIDAVAKKGNPEAIDFPRSMIHEEHLDFSFSGLKSAVLNYLNQQKMKNLEINAPDVAASFQAAVVDVLVHKTLRAVEITGVDTLVLSGGVASNSLLRSRLTAACEEQGLSFYRPSPILCTDNAAMIASMAYYQYLAGDIADLSLNAKPRLKIDEM
jgi:N6-L-threonylcarbamoyladenine synthase